ncbi:putative SKP1/BTB/POZ domain, NPH3 domain-containing protein [Rosa chinensis]|uniref:Putative SKP1/BTB/POZ domain, NPH3 domain-containing protein n=1 Tax=Rosa chinensis TaxID=74649 RepID=A0A2P6Q332_ROSCH|nr:BTB/POZ domain-containing protein At3g22104 isoform X1 [Rosa chinensis]PRQ28592.1 putative SKP1/BTB/POZ domain, NPH3 domain-containing protein [Rosa chinensis]
MAMFCDLQVDVNGEEVFMVNKKTLASFSCRLSKLFGKSMGTTSLKVIFHDFPGGAEGFELMTRFCYNNGTIEITPSNLVLVYCIANFMEMDGDILLQAQNTLDGISSWTWSELLVALKQCQDLLAPSNSSLILQIVMDCIIGKLSCPFFPTPNDTTSSENVSSFQFSSGSRSSYNLKSNCSMKTWWFEDLMFLNTKSIEMVIRSLISKEIEQSTVFKFLLRYHQSKCFGAKPEEKCKITEVVIGLLSLLDRRSLSFKGLFNIYQAALNMKVGKKYKNKLEIMIGSHLDQATIDYLLVPSPCGKKYVYDVNLILRLGKSFLLQEGVHLSRKSRFTKVAKLMDLYLAEVAPDFHLKPSKFAALVMMLPASVRESHDRLYEAIAVYFKCHTGLSEQEKLTICCALNYKKLSAGPLKQASRTKFPSRRAVEAFKKQRSKLRSVHQEVYYIRTKDKKEEIESVLLDAKSLDLPTEAQKLSADLMHLKALELGKVFGTMQIRVTSVIKSRLPFQATNTRYLSKLFP